MALAQMHSDWMLIVSSLIPRPSPSFPSLAVQPSLVPRPSTSFPSLAVRLSVMQVMGSWARAWEWG